MGTRARNGALETEEALHLMPGGDAEEKAEGEQDEERDEEAEPGQTTRAPTLDTGPALRPLEPIRPLDRERVDGYRLVARPDLTRWLRHRSSVVECLGSVGGAAYEAGAVTVTVTVRGSPVSGTGRNVRT